MPRKRKLKVHFSPEAIAHISNAVEMLKERTGAADLETAIFMLAGEAGIPPDRYTAAELLAMADGKRKLLADLIHARRTSDPAPATPPSPTPKRSAERGGGRVKLIAALTKHHQYADSGCLNLEPIGNNELARLAGVAKRTASAFFNKEFRGHGRYKALCSDAGWLGAALKLLNGEYSPHLLYGNNPPPEKADRDDDGDE
jgi:hypothetical protein